MQEKSLSRGHAEKLTTVSKLSLPKVMSRMTAKKSTDTQIHSHKPTRAWTHRHRDAHCMTGSVALYQLFPLKKTITSFETFSPKASLDLKSLSQSLNICLSALKGVSGLVFFHTYTNGECSCPHSLTSSTWWL